MEDLKPWKNPSWQNNKKPLQQAKAKKQEMDNKLVTKDFKFSAKNQ